MRVVNHTEIFPADVKTNAINLEPNFKICPASTAQSTEEANLLAGQAVFSEGRKKYIVFLGCHHCDNSGDALPNLAKAANLEPHEFRPVCFALHRRTGSDSI